MALSIIRAVSIGALGGLAAFLAFGPVAPHGAQLFALLIGWAGYSHFGSKLEGLKQALVHFLLGAALAALALVLVTQLPYGETLGAAAWTGIAAAATLAALAYVARLPGLGSLSVALLGYAALLACAAVGGADKIVALAPDNCFLVAFLSLAAGALLGLAADALADAAEKRLPLGRSPTRSATSA
ncbi:DUF1097 family protein [Methylosinus sp. Sm6]|uniref:DUF1097 family protein n=1 Tax=Methylosinus sp. Sm6 TaxID=2866948 RepID=UPI001C99EA27|nr:DUF1097 family protein [Methylosinus sp. Sm6]MBY6242271.1 DUF1097 family protein [Methylosinus sp. Sm6]